MQSGQVACCKFTERQWGRQTEYIEHNFHVQNANSWNSMQDEPSSTVTPITKPVSTLKRKLLRWCSIKHWSHHCSVCSVLVYRIHCLLHQHMTWRSNVSQLSRLWCRVCQAQSLHCSTVKYPAASIIFSPLFDHQMCWITHKIKVPTGLSM